MTSDFAGAPTIDGYTDLVRIGRGGFSVVYRARQTAFDRDVALKLLLADFSDEADARRYRNECAVLGRIGRHENIVDVYDAGLTIAGLGYIAMPLYLGGSLGSVLKATGPLPPVAAIPLIIEIAHALAFAHEQGVIHRDIKPDNILIDESGKLGLADFGVAAIADAHGGFTRSVAFSPSHVAPETLECFEFSPSSDQYSLASTLFTLLSGRRAFEAPTEAMQIVAVTTKAAPLLDLPTLPEVAAVVHRAMSRDPGDRFPDVGAFAAALSDASREALGNASGFASNGYRFARDSRANLPVSSAQGAIDLTRVRERTVPPFSPQDAATEIESAASHSQQDHPTEPDAMSGSSGPGGESRRAEDSELGSSRRVRKPHLIALGAAAVVLAGIGGFVSTSSSSDSAAVVIASPSSDPVVSAQVTPPPAVTPPAATAPKAPKKKRKKPKPKATSDGNGSEQGGQYSYDSRPVAPSRPRPVAPARPEPPTVWE